MGIEPDSQDASECITNRYKIQMVIKEPFSVLLTATLLNACFKRDTKRDMQGYESARTTPSDSSPSRYPQGG
ncbi:hypothetical protein EMQ_2082 [Acetobacter aceti NBRC 14818]|uniref:Uncharacterized protein n=1 Tax=Acetobacter aceti NBRC 14818 TaxID=887700 RepID=A0AB33IF08_ACEAC|nr:hypothetical protein EMQ_2082 [Acetobacter aceti NBRC 14818]GAN56216.1 hypothetical protein Abac_003_115 [Acetobacter aceti NBRC 14818]